jgi:5-formyltetrahydrofolate cyclo-ligase
MPGLAADKAALRRSVLARRDDVPAAERAELSARITRHLLDLPAFAAAGTVLAYLSIGTECDTQAFVAAVLGQGKRLVLPRVERAARRLQLFHVSDLARQTTAGTWGIQEPVPGRCPPVEREEVSMVLAPGIAFTPRGDRLGYGGGYYDRLLRDWPARPPVIAAAFAYDVRIDSVVTEDGRVQPPS